jgi:hypothetical protein
MYDLVVVSMFKNENMILKEWLDHHISVGVQHFYLLDNGSTDDYATILKHYQDNGMVTLFVDPSRYTDEQCQRQKAPSYDHTQKRIIYTTEDNRHTQELLLNRYFLAIIKALATWVLVIDQDEYMFSTQDTLRGVLSSVDGKCSSIWVPWRVFGSGGHKKQPPSIRKGFLHMRPFHEQKELAINKNVRGNGKSITRVSSIKRLGTHVCSVWTNPEATLTPDGRYIKKDWTVPTHPTHGFLWKEWMGSYSPDPSKDLFFCNHYMVMSEEYFRRYKSKRSRGTRPSKLRGQTYFNKNNKGCNQIDTLIMSAKGTGE